MTKTATEKMSDLKREAARYFPADASLVKVMLDRAYVIGQLRELERVRQDLDRDRERRLRSESKRGDSQ